MADAVSFAGRKQVHKIVLEGFKHQSPSPSLNDVKKPEDLKLVMEGLQAKMEELQEDMKKATQRNKISAKSVTGSEPLKKIQNEAICDCLFNWMGFTFLWRLQVSDDKKEESFWRIKKVIERAEIIHKPFADFKSQDTSYFESNVEKEPEDVIRVFTMKESIGRQFLDGLTVPSVKLTRENLK